MQIQKGMTKQNFLLYQKQCIQYDELNWHSRSWAEKKNFGSTMKVIVLVLWKLQDQEIRRIMKLVVLYPR